MLRTMTYLQFCTKGKLKYDILEVQNFYQISVVVRPLLYSSFLILRFT